MPKCLFWGRVDPYLKLQKIKMEKNLLPPVSFFWNLKEIGIGLNRYLAAIAF